MIKPKKYFGCSSAVTRVFFLAYWYMYQDEGFNKSIEEHTVRQTDWQKLWLYVAAFWCQTTKQSYKIIKKE